jgi:hypothetical protein
MKELKFEAVAMALIEDKRGNKEWIVHGRSGGETFKIYISVGEFQMQTLERALEAAVLPCA